MGEIVRIITSDGAVMASAITGTDIVARASQIHNTSATATAALGRTLLAASMMGNQLKGEENSLTLQIRGDGPIGGITCVSDYNGNVRGFAANPQADTDRKYEGKLNVGALVGAGSLTVIKDLGMRDPYVGTIPLVSGEIAEDVTAYYAESEQIPTACALGVLVKGGTNDVIAAGGFLIQMLPGATDEEISRVERGLARVKPVTTEMSEGKSVLDIVTEILSEFDIEILDRTEVSYKCYCTRERVIKALISIGTEEMTQLIAEQGQADLTCQFCDAVYHFDRGELQDILDSMWQ